jgi:hypothetical protein
MGSWIVKKHFMVTLWKATFLGFVPKYLGDDMDGWEPLMGGPLGVAG